MWNNNRFTWNNTMIELFKEKGLKLTKHRKQVYNAIDKLEEATLKDIQNKCQNQMNRVTIYRIIELFLEKNIITKNVDNNDIYYSINKHKHEHYIYCVNCHKKTKIDICPIDSIEDKGYKLISHQLKLNGICSECQKK